MPVLQFKGKSAVESYHKVVPHHALEIDKKLSLSKNPSLDDNLIIEGDNLLALKALLPTHAGRIKCIYIDPPYNTGNEGWIYNDNLTQPQFKEWIGKTVGKEGEDACRHDKWCCMMYPRLQLLRELLASDGILLVSIDDNEFSRLKLILDEIFGEDAHVTSIVWRTRNTDNRVKSMLSVDHEYVLVYAMGSGTLRGRVIDRSDFKNPDNDPRGPYVTDPLTGKATKQERPNLHFPIFNPKSKARYDPDPSRGWITDPEGVRALIEDNRVTWPEDPKTGNPRKKRFLSETSERMPVGSFWSEIKGQSGADEVDHILGRRLFAFPKSLEFMCQLLDVAAGSNDLFLDATAGSGTTAHALLELNRRDGGDRKFVLIQKEHDNLEQAKEGLNICQQVTRERLDKVIRGYTRATQDGNRETVKGIEGTFTYARVGNPLFSEYRELGETPPNYLEMAKYVWFTETSRPFEAKQIDSKTGKIGELDGTSYFLLYEPGKKEARALDADFLKTLKDKNKRKVVYCEKIWIHRDELAQYGEVRPMIVPFNLK